jgi:mannose-6-phosphate isomerase-like protein (cupin superfamily)
MYARHRDELDAFETKDGSEIREYLRPGSSPHERQSVAEALLPPGGATVRHVHPVAEEVYFVLQGEAEMEVDGATRRVRAECAVAIPPGTPHRITNAGEGELRFLCICVPAYTHEDTVLLE